MVKGRLKESHFPMDIYSPLPLMTLGMERFLCISRLEDSPLVYLMMFVDLFIIIQRDNSLLMTLYIIMGLISYYVGVLIKEKMRKCLMIYQG